ncbi:hypothetical protein D3C77_645800 [compost metagenome]
MDITRSQHRDNKEAQGSQQYAVGGQIAYRYQRIRVGNHDTGVFQPHHGNKQADTAGDAHPQAQRDIGNHPIADTENGQQQETDCAPENSTHANLP